MIELYDSFLCGKRCRARKRAKQAKREAEAQQVQANANLVNEQNALQAQLTQQLTQPLPLPDTSHTQPLPLGTIALSGAGLILLLLAGKYLLQQKKA